MKYGVGIDISKGKSTVAIMSVEGEIIEKPFEIIHNNEGLELLEKKIKNINKEDLKIVMENTGTYHLPVLGYLLDKGYFAVTKNALEIKKYLDRGLRKAKTDKKDAYKLAEYACDNWYKLERENDNEEIYNNLKFLSRQYLATISIQMKQKINFSHLVMELYECCQANKLTPLSPITTFQHYTHRQMLIIFIYTGIARCLFRYIVMKVFA